MRHYIIRNNLYDEETRLEEGISQQVCVDVSYYKKPVDVYSAHKENGFLVQGDLIAKNIIHKSHAKLIVYINSDILALELAQRWCDEAEQKKKGYHVFGIDKNYSVFD